MLLLDTIALVAVMLLDAFVSVGVVLLVTVSAVTLVQMCAVDEITVLLLDAVAVVLVAAWLQDVGKTPCQERPPVTRTSRPLPERRGYHQNALVHHQNAPPHLSPERRRSVPGTFW